MKLSIDVENSFLNRTNKKEEEQRKRRELPTYELI